MPRSMRAPTISFDSNSCTSRECHLQHNSCMKQRDCVWNLYCGQSSLQLTRRHKSHSRPPFLRQRRYLASSPLLKSRCLFLECFYQLFWSHFICIEDICFQRLAPTWGCTLYSIGVCRSRVWLLFQLGFRQGRLHMFLVVSWPAFRQLMIC